MSIPAADVSVLDWIDVQDDLAASVRALIRESIERVGYIDVVNRPVGPQPRRGRPPGSPGSPSTGAAAAVTFRGGETPSDRDRAPAADAVGGLDSAAPAHVEPVEPVEPARAQAQPVRRQPAQPPRAALPSAMDDMFKTYDQLDQLDHLSPQPAGAAQSAGPDPVDDGSSINTSGSSSAADDITDIFRSGS